jgi:hypothetical protein
MIETVITTSTAVHPAANRELSASELDAVVGGVQKATAPVPAQAHQYYTIILSDVLVSS